MEEILVNKGNLKNAKDIIDKLLKLGKENVPTHTQFTSHASEELGVRQKEILKYVGKKPGATKEDVIKNNPHIGSRMTIAKAIKELIEMKMLIVKRGLNQHIQHLYTNNEHEVLSLFNDLVFFKQVYFRLIDVTNKKLTKLSRQSQTDVGRYGLMWRLVEALLMPYKNLMYITSDILLWQKQPIGKETSHKKFDVLHDSMKEIQIKLHESVTPVITSPLDSILQIEPLRVKLYGVQTGLNRQQIIDFLGVYGGLGIGAFVEPVLDILWKISYPILPLVDQLYASEDREKLKDWRNIIKGNEEFNYVPKTAQAKNLGKLLP